MSSARVDTLNIPNHAIVVDSVNAVMFGMGEINFYFKNGRELIVSLDEDEYEQACDAINEVFQ